MGVSISSSFSPEFLIMTIKLCQEFHIQGLDTSRGLRSSWRAEEMGWSKKFRIRALVWFGLVGSSFLFPLSFLLSPFSVFCVN